MDSKDLGTIDKLEQVVEWLSVNKEVLQKEGLGVEFSYTGTRGSGVTLRNVCLCSAKDYIKIMLRVFLNMRQMLGWEKIPMQESIQRITSLLNDLEKAGVIDTLLTDEDR